MIDKERHRNGDRWWLTKQMATNNNKKFHQLPKVPKSQAGRCNLCPTVQYVSTHMDPMEHPSISPGSCSGSILVNP